MIKASIVLKSLLLLLIVAVSFTGFMGISHAAQQTEGNNVVVRTVVLPSAVDGDQGSGENAGNSSVPSGIVPYALYERNKEEKNKPHVSDAWARPAPTNGVSAIFLKLQGGSQDDRIIDVSTGWASNIFIQRTVKGKDGQLHGQRIKRLRVPANVAANFTPAGFYLIVGPLTRELKDSQLFPIILTFEKSGQVRVMVQVQAQRE